jgi:hypothetical protein
MAQHSWWLPEKVYEKDYGAYESNVNVLIPGELYSKTGFGGSQVKSLMCQISRVEAE